METTIERAEFLQRNWADDAGTRFIASSVPGDKESFQRYGFETNAEAIAFAASEIEKRKNVFFGVHLFDGKGKKAENAIGSRAYYLDIDCGEGKAYKDISEALQAVSDMSRDTGLPEPTVVASGTGIHCYWFLSHSLPGDVWLENARRLEAICKVQRLKVDSNVTKDRARVMRCPGSSNRKDPADGDGKPCKVLLPGKVHDPAEIRAILDRHTPAIPSDKATEINDSFTAGLDNDSEFSKAVARLSVRFITGDQVTDYDPWMNVGFACWNTFGGSSEGLQLWDEVSRRSPKYKPGVCSEKWQTMGELSDGEKATAGTLYHMAEEAAGEDFLKEFEDLARVERIENRYQLTDAGNARRLIDTDGDIVRFDRTRRFWYVNNGQYWVENAWADVLELAKRTVEAMRSDVARMKAEDDESKKNRDKLLTAVNKFDMQPRLEAMVKAAATTPEISVSAEDFNSDPDTLNFSNGILNLRTGELTPHRAGGMFTYCLDVAYDPDAKCGRVEKFLNDITCGDRSLLKYMQRAIGYTLTGCTSEEKFFVAYGKGQNGKGSLFEALALLLGPLSTPIRTSALMQHKLSSHSSHNDDIASLEGKRLALMTEAGRGRQYDLELIKQITGGGRLRASKKHQASSDFTPICKLWIEANDLPDIPSMDDATKRRLRVIPFAADIPDEQRDDTLKPYLKTPEAQSALLVWAVEGAIEWYRKCLGSCDAVTSATAAYFAEQDIAANFIFERCERGESFKSPAMAVYEEFESYCKGIGIATWKPQHLATELRRLGFTPGRTRAVRFWSGFRVRDQAEIYRDGLAAAAG